MYRNNAVLCKPMPTKLDVPGLNPAQQSSGAATAGSTSQKKLFLTTGNVEVRTGYLFNWHNEMNTFIHQNGRLTDRDNIYNRLKNYTSLFHYDLSRHTNVELSSRYPSQQ